MEWNGNQGTWLLIRLFMVIEWWFMVIGWFYDEFSFYNIPFIVCICIYIYMCIICYTLYIYHFALDDIVWAKQCHKPPMFGNYWGGMIYFLFIPH